MLDIHSKTPVALYQLAQGLSDVELSDTINKHADRDELHIISRFWDHYINHPDDIPSVCVLRKNPLPAMVTDAVQHALNLLDHLFSSSDGSRRGTIVQLPDHVVHDLSAVVTASKPHAAKIHSHYPALHQHETESSPLCRKRRLTQSLATLYGT